MTFNNLFSGYLQNVCALLNFISVGYQMHGSHPKMFALRVEKNVAFSHFMVNCARNLSMFAHVCMRIFTCKLEGQSFYQIFRNKF